MNQQEIRQRYNKGQRHRQEYHRNCLEAIARDYNMPATTLRSAFSRGNGGEVMDREEYEEAERRLSYGKEQKRLYLENSELAIKKSYGITHHELKSIVQSSNQEPVRRFLTMRLAG